MGQYSDWKGDIKFKTKEHFKKFKAEIISHGWYSTEKECWASDGGFFDEGDHPKFIDEDNLTITLPNVNINNFHRVINLLEANTWTGELRGVSDDGDLNGWIAHPDGSEESFDLQEWAAQHGHTLSWNEDYEDWETEERRDVMDAFLEEPKPPQNSTKFISND